jgi:hypothetical protein
MDISRSDSWTARALVFSGRPDPVWTVDAATVAALCDLWERMGPTRSPAAAPPPLGYRGVELRAPDGRVFTAVGGTVVLRGDARVAGGEARDDPGRDFERRLRASAPPDTVPPADL